jgi:hypothetical protein
MKLPVLSRGERWLALALLLTLPLANPYPRGEGNGHYAYLPSLLIDHDLQLEDEYRHGDPDFLNSTFRRADAQPWPPLRMPTGRLRNAQAVGAALLWAPSFLQAHALVHTLRALGFPVSADGWGLAYRAACATASAVMGMLALLLALRAARRVASGFAALVAALALWLASPLPVYMYFLPFYGHAPAAFVAALFLWYWLARRPLRGPAQWATWGAIGGLLFATDHLAALLLVAAAFEGLQALRERGAAAALRDLSACAAGVLLGALPELAVKWVLHGSPLRSGRLNRFFWSTPQWRDVGFSAQHGLFVWTPVLLLAVIGLVLLLRRREHHLVAAALLCAFALTYYVVASYEAWHGASSFGNRFFVPLTAAFVLGLAALVDDAVAALRALVPPRAARAAVAAVVALLAAWNLGFVFQWGSGMVPRQGPVDLRVVARNQVQAVPQRVAGFALRYLRARGEVSGRQEGTPR